MDNNVVYDLKIHVRTPNMTLVKIGNKGIHYSPKDLFAQPPNVSTKFKRPYAKKLSGKEKREATTFIIDTLGEINKNINKTELTQKKLDRRDFIEEFGDDIVDAGDEDKEYKLQYIIQHFNKNPYHKVNTESVEKLFRYKANHENKPNYLFCFRSLF